MKLTHLVIPIAAVSAVGLIGGINLRSGRTENPSTEKRRTEKPRAIDTEPKVIRSEACWPPGPPSLGWLCQKSDTIVLGQVRGIVRVAHSVPGVVTSTLKTVYEVAVERYLEWDGAPQQPPTLKVGQSGGIEEGTVYTIEGDPLLNVGDRYILFLIVAKRDRLAWDEVWGVSLFKGECSIADRIRGKLRLVDGRTTVPNDPYQTVRPWAFEYGGGSLLDLAQGEAIARIEAAVAAAPKQLPGGGYPGQY